MTKRFAVIPAFIRRDWAIERSYRFALVLEILAALSQLALFFYLGRLVGKDALGESQDLKEGYFSFAVIGLALLTLLYAGLGAYAGRLREDQTNGTLEAVLATSTPGSLIILGSGVFDLVRAVLSAAALILVAVLLFGFRPEVGAATAVALILGIPAFMALLAALGVGLAAFTIVFKDTGALLGMAISAVALVAGVYYPVEILPSPLDTLGQLLPVTWGLDLLRAALLRDELDVSNLALLVGSSAILLPLSLAIFSLALDRAKRSGTLSQY